MLHVAIVNPLNLIGKELQSILRERSIATAVELIDTTVPEAGTLTSFDDEAVFVSPASRELFAGNEVIFFCGESPDNRQWVEQLSQEAYVIDLIQPSSMEDGVPVVAGVNDQEIDRNRVILSPHPIATQLALVFDRLETRSAIRLCAASVIQPASEHGQAGVDELFKQTVSALNVEGPPTEVFERQLAFNLYPAPNAAQLEEYVSAQLRSIVRPDLPLSLSVTQGTTFHGHSISLFVQLEDEVDESELAALFAKSSTFDVAAAESSYATIDSAGSDQILIGRIRRDPQLPRSFWIWIVSDNLRRSSALNAALLAQIIRERFHEPVN
jgi:aspartate-semialdehyde dehydrogenase